MNCPDCGRPMDESMDKKLQYFTCPRCGFEVHRSSWDAMDRYWLKEKYHNNELSEADKDENREWARRTLRTVRVMEERKLDESISWQEAKEQVDAEYWVVNTRAVNEDRICVSIYKGVMGKDSDIYVCGPNWIERRFKITFEKKVIKAINFRQKECDTLNARTRRMAELDVMAEAMLTVAEMEREGKTITLGDLENKK